MKAFNRVLTIGALFFATACTSAGLALLNLPTSLKGGYTLHEASYGSGKLHKLDIYVPDKDKGGQKSVVVFFYGGRWQTGKKEDFRFIGAALAKRGFIAVIPEFRKYPEVRFPVFLEDGAKALAWVDDHIADYNGKREAIHMMGHSSGAHMAAMLMVDAHYLAAEHKESRTLIKDFAGLAGPYAFTPDEKDLIDIFGPPENYPRMQATSFINGREPPMLLLYGEKDSSVKAFNHQRLQQAILDKGGRVDIKLYPSLGHIGILTTFSPLGPESPVIDDVTAFFRANENLPF